MACNLKGYLPWLLAFMFDVHETTAAAYSVTVDGDSFIYSASNQACLDLVGLTQTFMPGLGPEALFTEPTVGRILQYYRTCRDTRQAVTYICESNLAAGTRRWRTTLIPMTNGPSGRVTSIVGICVDAPDEAHADHHVETRHEKLELAMDAMDGGFWVYEMETGVFETSVSLAQYIAGPGRISLSLAEYSGYVHAEDLRPQDILRPKCDRSTAEYRVITFEGRTRWLQSRRRVIRDREGAIVRVIGLVMDVTDQKKALTTLESEATTDPLTSLKNRRAFDRAAAQAFEAARRIGGTIGVLLIDLDGFKPINDHYGHRAGDEILRKIARRLARTVGDTHLLARIGGDEFAILIGEASPLRGEALALRIAGCLEKPLRLDSQRVLIGVSVGLAIATPTDISVAALIERADRNLYAAKRERQLLSA